MNGMRNEIILKTLIVLEIILLIVLFPGMILISFLTPNQEVFDIIFHIVLCAILLVGVLFILLWPILGGISSKPTRAEKMPLLFSDFTNLKNFLDDSLKNKGYQKHFDMFYHENNIDISVYIRKRKIKVLNCFVVVKVDELSNISIEIINDHITNLLHEYYDGAITDSVNMFSLICVDRITSDFNKFMNTNIEQGLKNGRFLAGVSFGGKHIYIAKQQDGFAIMRYKRMRNHFLDIMGIPRDGTMCSTKN